MEESSSSVTITSLADEIIAEVFSYCGSVHTARCAQSCRNFCRVSKNSRALWRRFVYDEFGLAQGSDSADWYAVYRYIKQQQKAYFDGLILDEYANISDDNNLIPSQLVFCDDGSHQPGNNPEHALNRTAHQCWCTNAFVDHDVDLVADLTTPHLVMALEVANGGMQYSAPVKEALAFASLELPNLEMARQYDGSKGITIARQPSQSQHSNKVPLHHPLAGFCFPRQAYNVRLQKPVVRPTVARYVHFKLLTSSKDSNRVSNNIDVCSLLAFGVPLPRLNELIHAGSEDSNNNTPDPSKAYSRRHKVREYPWHIHDAFAVQIPQQILERRQMVQQAMQLLDEGDHEEEW